jgi:hypothetical protein
MKDKVNRETCNGVQQEEKEQKQKATIQDEFKTHALALYNLASEPTIR